MIQNRVIDELRKEQQLSREPGYRSRYDEAYDAGPHVDPDEIKKEPGRKKQSEPKDRNGSDGEDSASDKKKDVRNDNEHDRLPRPHERPGKGSGKSGKEGSSSRKNEANDDFGKGILD